MPQLSGEFGPGGAGECSLVGRGCCSPADWHGSWGLAADSSSGVSPWYLCSAAGDSVVGVVCLVKNGLELLHR